VAISWSISFVLFSGAAKALIDQVMKMQIRDLLTRVDFMRYSARKELDRREYSRRFSESLHPLLRRLRVVFPGKGHRDGVPNARAAGESGPNRDFEIADLNRPTWLLPEGAEPSVWLVAPGARKDPAVNDHDPDTRVAVLSSSANADDLRFSCRFNHGISERRSL
jgi:hypothetical protein